MIGFFVAPCRPAGVVGDGVASNLLLHFDGADASTTITDSSPSAHSPTAVGNAQIDTAQSVFGGASLLLDVNDTVTIPDHADWDLGTGDFTIDFRVRFSTIDGAGANNMVNFGATDIRLAVVAGSKFRTTLEGTTTDNSWSPSTNTWYHVAVTRASGSLRVFINGTQIGSTQTNNGNVAVATSFVIGAAVEGLRGWLDEFRLVKGTAVWTANFTPPAAAYVGIA